MSGYLVVVGDALLDRDLDGRVERLCPDAPVPVVDNLVTCCRPGGAGLAAALAAADGVQVVLVTALADDHAAAELAGLLDDAGVEVVDLGLEGRTPEKVRVRTDGRTLVRLDHGARRAAVGPLDAAGRAGLGGASAVLVADYGRGITGEPTVRDALASCAQCRPVVWDPHPRGATPVAGVRLATPNQAEAARLVPGLGEEGAERPTVGGDLSLGEEGAERPTVGGDLSLGEEGAERPTVGGDPNLGEEGAERPTVGGDPNLGEEGAERPTVGGNRMVGDSLRAVTARARELRERWGAGGVAVTLGERGALLVAGDGTPLAIPARPLRGPVDACGAGDRFASRAATALVGGALLTEAVTEAVDAATAFVAAGGAAGACGGSPHREGLGGSAFEVAERVRAAGGTVVATGGCFDLLHAGHVRMLRAARALGDCLVVLLNSDASVRRLKGPGRPVVPQADRAAVLAGLSCVDAVTVFDEDTPEACLDRLRPDIWTKGADYTVADLPEARLVASWGGQAVVVPYLAGRSTTRLIEGAIRNARS